MIETSNAQASSALVTGIGKAIAESGNDIIKAIAAKHPEAKGKGNAPKPEPQAVAKYAMPAKPIEPDSLSAGVRVMQ